MLKTQRLDAPATLAKIREQLERILASRTFVQSARMSRFLRFVVEMALDFRADELKETTIALAVFDRDPEYNPKTDPVVRNEARRLRAKLDQYYETEGVEDTVRIGLPKGGYVPVFITAETAPAGLPEEVAPPPVTEPAQPGFRRWIWLAGVAAVAAGVIFAAVRVGSVPTSPAGPIRIQPLTNYAGVEFDPAIAPDGKRVAFVWDGGRGNFNLYVKKIVGPAVRLTENASQDLYPAWSPDGRRIAFVRVNRNDASLMVMAAEGGNARIVRPLRGFHLDLQADQMHSPGPAWTHDGRYLIVGELTEGEPGFPFYQIPVDGGEARRLTNPGESEHDFYPRFSPDGKTLAFSRLFTNSASEIFVVPAAGGEPKRLTKERRDIRGLSWLPDGRGLIISSNRTGAYQLWNVPVDGRDPKLVAVPGESATQPAVAPDGSWLTYQDSAVNANVWRTGIVKAAGPAEKLIASSRQNHSAVYSPDGKRIAFVSDRNGTWEIWTAAADGSGPVQMTNFHGPMLGTPHWSPDGKWITFDARPEGHSAIFLISSSGGAPKPLSGNRFEEKMPVWSHDGHWVYFNSNREGGVQIWKAPVADGAPAGPAQVVCRCMAYDSEESADGRTLYFLGAELQVNQVSTAGGDPSPVPGLEGVNTGRVFCVGRDGIYFMDQGERRGDIQFYRFGTRRIETVTKVAEKILFGTPSLSVSPDGKWLLYALVDESHSDLMLAQGIW